MNQKQRPGEKIAVKSSRDFAGSKNAAPHSVSRAAEAPQPIDR
jgi:hypothetical protein